MRHVVLALCLAGTTLTGMAGAATASLSDDSVEARRHAVFRLGESGSMDDVPQLVRALRDPDPLVRRLAERGMWQVWSRSGDTEIDRIFATGVEQMGRRELDAAVETFTTIVERRPEFAEGWNKRATAYFLRGDLEKSLADCDEVVKRNPYHFGVLSGYGMIYLELHQPQRALHYFERALAVNPNLLQVEETVEALRRALGKPQRDRI